MFRESLNMEQVKQNILSKFEWRHACKEFDNNKKIKDEDFAFLMKVASLSPSSFGLEPYEIFVLQNPQLLKQLHPHLWGAQKQLFTASHILMFVAKKDITVEDYYIKYMMNDVQQLSAEIYNLKGNLIHEHQIKEIGMLENQRYLVEWAARQAYIALGNVMSAAAQIDIDSCPVEGFIKKEVANILTSNGVIDANKHSPIAFCCLGYRLLPPPHKKTRKPLEELVHYVQ